MTLLQLDVELLHSAIINACYNLIAQREALNAINLFPVADGDTGNNMAATAKSIIHHGKIQPTLEGTLRSIANAGILGARGNSGMIFSQFFNGLLESGTVPAQLNSKQLTDLIRAASRSVRSSIVNPVEGTILTVMEAWSAALDQLAEQTECIIELLQHSVTAVNEAIESTTNTLAVLKEAQVVDAGALGFGIFIEGFASHIKSPEHLQIYEELTACDDHDHDLPGSDAPPANRYCTEAMLAGECIDKTQLSDCLQTMGDSIVITANKSLSRLHIHTNQPQQVFSALSTFAKVQYPKVDDMLRQYEVLHARQGKIALVTDSSANIPQEILDQYQIHMIPLNVQFDGHDLLDKYGIDSNTFYDHLAGLATYPTTSCPSPAIINEKIKHLAEHYEEVLIISVAQVLSGTHDAMVNAAKALNNVHIINSKQVSGSQGLLVYYAAELIASGQNIDAIKHALTDKISKTRILVMVNQFDSLIRSSVHDKNFMTDR